MQRERVQDQYPWTWEIPLAVVCGVLVVGVGVLQLGRSLVNWFAGAGWQWPAPDKLVASIPALLAGDAAAGLSGVQHPASAAALWVWLTVVGLFTITASTLACVWAWRRWGPGRMRGMATTTEAHQLLGEDRLWKVRHVVRPDLYPSVRKANR
jgi:protein-S-isoprenylcysteine O-methyltransferase Ste14